MRAPFTGLLVGVREDTVGYPGEPPCHLAEFDASTVEVVESGVAGPP